jgi:hypothetical protein
MPCFACCVVIALLTLLWWVLPYWIRLAHIISDFEFHGLQFPVLVVFFVLFSFAFNRVIIRCALLHIADIVENLKITDDKLETRSVFLCFAFLCFALLCFALLSSALGYTPLHCIAQLCFSTIAAVTTHTLTSSPYLPPSPQGWRGMY